MVFISASAPECEFAIERLGWVGVEMEGVLSHLSWNGMNILEWFWNQLGLPRCPVIRLDLLGSFRLTRPLIPGWSPNGFWREKKYVILLSSNLTQPLWLLCPFANKLLELLDRPTLLHMLSNKLDRIRVWWSGIKLWKANDIYLRLQSYIHFYQSKVCVLNAPKGPNSKC